MRNTLMEVKKGQTGTGLLIENDGYISLDVKDNRRLCESFDGASDDLIKLPRPFILSAVFQKYGIENANGRVYPEDILKREVSKYQKAIEERRAYGECNHPESSAIDLGRLAINIIELHWEGHTLVGKLELPITEGFRRYGIVSTLADTIAQWIISGLKVGVSSRGLGSVKQEFGKLVVGDDYEIVCWDVVSQPSTPLAWIGRDDNEIRPYVESKETNKKVVSESENNKYGKFKMWLNG